MILVDDRSGSAELVRPLVAAGLPAQVTRLAFADVAFEGKGPAKTALSIGVELKTLGDLVSSLRSGRLAGHQLPGLRKLYDYTWLVVEGAYGQDERGQLIGIRGKRWAMLPGKMTASELDKQVLTLELAGGLHVRYTNSRNDTVRFLGSLYRWWTDRALDRHTSHLALHQPPQLVAVSAFRQAVCKWPGIGIRTSAAVEREFGASLRRATHAGVQEWAEIILENQNGQTRRLGHALAARIVTFISTGEVAP